MRKSVAAGIVLTIIVSTPAFATNNNDIAGAMGMLWRLQDHICPRLSFDPAALGKLTKPKAMSPDRIRLRYAKDFKEGMAKADEQIKQDGIASFCKETEDFFGGKLDFWGHTKEAPEPPFPGLIIQN